MRELVSSLIREVAAEARTSAGLIKQVFILTHNVYFHKEVSYKKPGDSPKDTTFWIVRKRSGVSEIVRHEGNPIQSSYELLWHDVRNPEGAEMTLQNTLRRIIESYFKILGGIDNDDLLSRFSDRERITCSALLSWANDGSHGARRCLHRP